MEKSGITIEGNLESIAYCIDIQTYNERMEFANWFANLDEHSPEYIASALSDFSNEFDWTNNIVENEE